jgi:AraC-like DNA-binding protein
MSQAAYLLTNSTLPVADIIESVGYDNTSYFYRKFKEWYGMGPKEYRAGK